MARWASFDEITADDLKDQDSIGTIVNWNWPKETTTMVVENKEDFSEPQGARKQNPKNEGGLQPLLCARCGEPIEKDDDTEQHPDGTRSHQLQRCFDLVTATLTKVAGNSWRQMKEGAKGEIAYSDQIRELTMANKELTKQVKELQEQVEARDEELTRAAAELEEESGSSKKKK